MHRFTTLWFIPALAVALAAGCTAEVEDPGELPDVDIEGGRAPEIDIDPANIDVTQDTQTVVVPEVEAEPANP